MTGAASATERGEGTGSGTKLGDGEGKVGRRISSTDTGHLPL